jgi:DinB superfamily
MKKSEIKVMPEYFDGYINEIEDMELSDALDKYGPDLLIPLKEKLAELGDKVYSPGKWTINDILQHLIDAERIFNYRALTFARGDTTHLPGFEENDYAKVSNAGKRALDELLNEFQNVRKSTSDLFNSFGGDILEKSGVCNDKTISVLALGFTIAGHAYHHTKVIKERYL